MLRLFIILVSLLASVQAAEPPDGAALYAQHCALCHGVAGQGVAGVFPPLAGSDFLRKNREQSLSAPLGGLSGKITVNGVNYEGAMPPVLLDDAQTAAVMAHVFQSWENKEAAPKAEEIAALRARTNFPTFAKLKEAMGSSVLPEPPAGWTLRVGAELSFSPSRLGRHPDGQKVFIVAGDSSIWTWQPESGEMAVLWKAADFADEKLGGPGVTGIATDREGRVYLTCNQRNTKVKPFMDEVTIFRTAPWQAEQPLAPPKAWLQARYPWGIGPFNHSVNHIAQGPDGFMYVNSGSRTDGGEAGKDDDYAKTGEDALTACMWRLDPKAEKPEIEIYARGLRNSYGFTWAKDGRLFASENGPDADAPEELNIIEQGKHYGFPHQFSDWEKKPYPHTPPGPAGVEFKRPFRNAGPDGGSGLASFEPHSCPAGLVWLDERYPEGWANSLVVTRFGNMIGQPQDTGFDVLLVKPKDDGAMESRRILGPLGRPLDVLELPGQRLVIAEYCRNTTNASGLGTPGRLLVLEPKVKKE